MKILVAGDPRSIHTARFTGLLSELGHRVDLFSVEPQYDQEEHLRDLTLHVPIAYQPGRNGVRVEGGYRWTAALLASRAAKRAVSRVLYARSSPGKVLRARAFARVADEVAPDVMLSLKMQNEGYTVAAARPAMRRRVPWIHFSWGTDIELFGKSAGHASLHAPLIRQAFARCDFHIADTLRDLDEAVTLGFRGTTLGVMVANGGFDLAELRAHGSTAAARDTILVKGRQGGYVGKALNVLRAIRRRPDSFRRFRTRIFMATADVQAEARALRADTGIDCEALPRLGYRDLLDWYARSIIAVSASDVDGTPGFLLEAMAMGALPVHSDMASIREWIAHGDNGLLFPVDDVAGLAECMERGLADAPLRERAAGKNRQLIAERADRARLREQLGEWLQRSAARP